jgi:Domain of unknown function (DUF4276)
VKLYVEGGGEAAALKTACREGFTKFITKAGLKNRPRVVACGSRRDAYDSFCTAIASGDDAMLLVDSEALVSDAHQAGKPTTWLPWAHLKQRQGDGWERPNGGKNDDCHLMVEVMENWFLADRNTLKSFFGNGFKENQLPAAARAVEQITKVDVYQTLQKATAGCKSKAAYGKGEHSFKLLALIDPATVVGGSPWARRFIDELKRKMDV